MLLVPDTDIARRQRAIVIWLASVAVLVFALVLVGGTTRLTESGLSIVEWKPVEGVLPPMSAAVWQAEFEKYQAIPQYAQHNLGMSLAEFKTIYWWEWTHRLLGRLVGVAYLLPFLWFLWRGWIAPRMRPALWGIFALGALQGVVGWWMVASGLVDRTEVSQYRLATHLLLASLIFSALVWMAQRVADGYVGAWRYVIPLTAPAAADVLRRRLTAIVILAFVLLQIYLGALVAGLRAGLIYNTWPLIDNAFIPNAERLFFDVPLWRNFFENTLTVQFDHRMVAYVVWAVAIIHAFDMLLTPKWIAAVGSAVILAVAVTLQAAVGILTLLGQAPIDLALLHQAVAMLVLATASIHAARVARA